MSSYPPVEARKERQCEVVISTLGKQRICLVTQAFAKTAAVPAFTRRYHIIIILYFTICSCGFGPFSVISLSL